MLKDVCFGPNNLGLDENETVERAREAIGLVGLDYNEICDRSPFELSGGQKRRVAIAGVIAMKPKVLVLDEPTAGLDPKAHRDILDMISSVHEHENNITILVSHNMNDIAQLADRVLVMDKGSMIMDGTPGEIFSKNKELREIGLDVPDITDIICRLNDKGFDLDPAVLDMEKAAEMVLSRLGGDVK